VHVEPESRAERPARYASRLWTERARPRAVAEHRHADWLVVAAVSIGAFMGQLDASIVSLGFPTMKRHFHATLGSVQWVGLSYLLVLVVLVPAAGRLADTVGRKLLYTYGFAVFVVGSALCGIAPSLLLLDAFRCLQAVGAAMMQANSVAIIALAVPRERLGRAIGVQGAAQAVGLSLGPVVGGLLIAAGGWRLIFLVNVPAGIVGAVIGWYVIPRSRDLQDHTRFDWLGLALFAPALGALLLALSFGSEIGWLSGGILAALATCIVLGGLFVVRMRRVAGPLIDPQLFRRRGFTPGIVSGLFSYLVLFGVLFATPFYLEIGRGMSSGLAGALLAILPVGLAVVAPFAGRASDRYGARWPTSTGMLIAASGLLLLAVAHDWRLVAAGLGVLGLGRGLFTPANNAAIMMAAPRAQASSTSGILNLTRGLGTALGLSLTGVILTSVSGAHVVPSTAARAFTAVTVFLALVAGVTACIAASPPAASGPLR
jgi:EmrB/QacA subfamily drug resistance transporter